MIIIIYYYYYFLIIKFSYRSINSERWAIDADKRDIAVDELLRDAVQHNAMMCKHYELDVGIFQQHLDVLLDWPELQHDSNVF